MTKTKKKVVKSVIEEVQAEIVQIVLILGHTVEIANCRTEGKYTVVTDNNGNVYKGIIKDGKLI